MAISFRIARRPRNGRKKIGRKSVDQRQDRWAQPFPRTGGARRAQRNHTTAVIALIGRRFLYAVDHKDLDGILARFQLKAELLLDGLEYVEVVHIGNASVIPFEVGRVSPLDVVSAAKSGLIDDGAVQIRLADGVHDIAHGRFREGHHHIAPLLVK